jgi:hypothetical protein
VLDEPEGQEYAETAETLEDVVCPPQALPLVVGTGVSLGSDDQEDAEPAETLKDAF